jgi:hypothetical protein
MNNTNTTQDKVEVGSIFHCSWGYDQTQADFYQVTRMTPKGVYVREIAAKKVEGSEGFMCQNVVAVKDQFVENKPETFHRLNLNTGYKPAFRISSFQTAFLWDGKPKYNSWYA